jgi:hypothetical protein
MTSDRRNDPRVFFGFESLCPYGDIGKSHIGAILIINRRLCLKPRWSCFVCVGGWCVCLSAQAEGVCVGSAGGGGVEIIAMRPPNRSHRHHMHHIPARGARRYSKSRSARHAKPSIAGLAATGAAGVAEGSLSPSDRHTALQRCVAKNAAMPA